MRNIRKLSNHELVTYYKHCVIREHTSKFGIINWSQEVQLCENEFTRRFKQISTQKVGI
jgi:hypothetical protein